MFNQSKSNPTQKQAPNGSATLITSGTTFTGDVHSENDLRIDGVIHGNVSSSAKIIVGPSGFVEGNLIGIQADISGRIVGNIAVKESIQLRSNCQVQGDLNAATFQADTGAVFNGKCSMGGAASNVVSMKETDALAQAK